MNTFYQTLKKQCYNAILPIRIDSPIFRFDKLTCCMHIYLRGDTQIEAVINSLDSLPVFNPTTSSFKGLSYELHTNIEEYFDRVSEKRLVRQNGA